MQTLRELPLFQDTPDNELTWLVEHSAEITLATGEFFAHEGEPTDTFLIVLDGEHYSWFLLEENGQLFLDTVCSYSAVNYMFLLEMTEPQVRSCRSCLHIHAQAND